jgi:hypothetical protein
MRIVFALFALWPATLLAATNDIPPLRPPRGEISAPTWNEQGWLASVAFIVVLSLLALCLRWLMRSRPPQTAPPEIVACQALERLRERPEDAPLAVEVSGIVRAYLRSVLKLPPEELTTAELQKTLEAYPLLDADLASATAEFLRYCDQVKFAPAPPGASSGAVVGALRLVGKFETRRRQAIVEGQPGWGSADAVGSGT